MIATEARPRGNEERLLVETKSAVSGHIRMLGIDVERDVNRLAVLRAGFQYLAREDPLAHKLYVMLAVFPDCHTFRESGAAVLLDVE